jgi:predicted transcriptional regulator
LRRDAEPAPNSLALDAWQIEATRAAMAGLDRGNEIAHEAVREWIESWGTANELEPPSAPKA